MKKAITSLRAFLRKTLWLWVRGVFFIMSKIPFLVVLLAVGYFAFVINDQGKDLMITFGELKTTHPYVLSFLALLIIWSGVVWYVARITLSSANLGRVVERRARLNDAFKDPACASGCELKDDYLVVTVDGRYQRTIQLLAKVTPRVLAALPYIIFIWGCWSVNGYSQASGKIWAAGLDVYENEPHILPELLELDNVVLAPHAGTKTMEDRIHMSIEMCRNIVGFYEGTFPVSRVN